MIEPKERRLTSLVYLKEYVDELGLPSHVSDETRYILAALLSVADSIDVLAEVVENHD